MQVNVTINAPLNGTAVHATFQATGVVSPNGKGNVRAYLINDANALFFGQRLDGATVNWSFQFTAVPLPWQHWVTLIVTGVDGNDIGSDTVDIQVGP